MCQPFSKHPLSPEEEKEEEEEEEKEEEEEEEKLGLLDKKELPKCFSLSLSLSFSFLPTVLGFFLHFAIVRALVNAF